MRRVGGIPPVPPVDPLHRVRAPIRGIWASVRSGARALHPLDDFAQGEHDHRRPNAPPRSREDADDHADSHEHYEPNDLGSTESDASALRHRLIMPRRMRRTSHL
jgi:hypothetical protein